MKRKRSSRQGPVAEDQRAEANGAASGEVGMPDATRQRLVELSTLEPDWDSYGALPVSQHALAAAGQIIKRVIERLGVAGVPHDIMPIADGGVALEWRYPRIEL